MPSAGMCAVIAALATPPAARGTTVRAQGTVRTSRSSKGRNIREFV
ncbi:hypothetical protein ACP70R_038856 [Stipagrostis hirtigluma subsp. patula]